MLEVVCERMALCDIIIMMMMMEHGFNGLDTDKNLIFDLIYPNFCQYNVKSVSNPLNPCPILT